MRTIVVVEINLDVNGMITVIAETETTGGGMTGAIGKNIQTRDQRDIVITIRAEQSVS